MTKLFYVHQSSMVIHKNISNGYSNKIGDERSDETVLVNSEVEIKKDVAWNSFYFERAITGILQTNE